ncbi:hypothetical protein MTP99_014243 [Tenebrio molitor]|nr:hypothetical protein MTP99_014243 [Tenebrio molitor]
MWSGSAYNGAAAWICMDGGSEQCDKLLHSAVFGTSGNVKNGEQAGCRLHYHCFLFWGPSMPTCQHCLYQLPAFFNCSI